MTLQFDTTPFRRSHGVEPKGRGSWAFGVKMDADPCDSDECWFSPGGMTLTEARKWAKGHALNKYGVTSGTLYVLP